MTKECRAPARYLPGCGRRLLDRFFRLLFFLRQHPAGRHSHVPITTFGYIVEARRRCRGVGTGLFTVMSRENLPGGGLGKIVSPQNLAVVTTAVQAPGKDAEILKKAAPFSLGLLVLLGALVFIAAQGWLGGYFPPGEPPGPSPLRPLRSTPFAEIGRTPARDRSASAPRSVAFRLEIGRTPARDRSLD